MNNLNRHSIRFRLTAWYAAILAATFAIAGIGVFLALRQSVRSTVDKELRSRLVAVRTYIDQEAPENDLSHLIEELKEETVMSPAAVNIRIAGPTGRWIFGSAGTDSWSVPAPIPSSLPATGEIRTVRVRGQALRIISAPVKIGSVQIGLPMDEFEEVQRGFLWTTALAAPLLLLLATLGGFWMSGRALRPVDQIADTARRITAHNLSERLPGKGTGDELQRLSAVLNGMLDRLEAGFNRISQFTADASHELRTPISIIRTTAEVTQSRPRTPDEHGKAWEMVQTQAERMSQLINDLLVLARADAGFGELVFETADLRQIVQDACTQMRIVTEAKGLTLAVHLQPCMVRADAEALSRALLIILDNAANATPPSGSIEVLMNETNLQLAHIEVRDTGIGISSLDLPHIFERFYRVAKDRSRNSGGVGLGLAIAQSIVARHGGKITVESALQKGSAFHIQLPAHPGPL